MKVASYSKKRVNIGTFEGQDLQTPQNILSLKNAALCYNFKFNRGGLNGKMGIDTGSNATITTPEGRRKLPALPDSEQPFKVHLYRRYDQTAGKRDDRLLVRTYEGAFYEIPLFDGTEYTLVQNLVADGADNSVNYRYNDTDIFILASEREGMIVYDGSTVTKVKNAPKITSLCVHKERIFATVGGEGNRVWFSDDFNPMNWNVSGEEAGYIDFDDEGGAAVKVVSFLDYLYIFREYGIMRLSAYGEQSEFSLTKLFTSTGRIMPQTIAECGDRIIFMAEDGFYSFDGYNLTAVMRNLTGRLPINKNRTRGCFMNGCYYLATRLAFNEYATPKILCETEPVYVNNALVIYDVKTAETNIIRGVDIRDITAVRVYHEASVYCTFHTYNHNDIGRVGVTGHLFDEPMPKFWTSGYTDLGYPARQKTVRDISFVTSADCVLGVVIDGQTTEYAVAGKKTPSRVVVNRGGSMVRLYIKTDAVYVEMTAPTLTVDIV